MMTKQRWIFSLAVLAVVLAAVGWYWRSHSAGYSRSIKPPEVDQVLDGDREALSGKPGVNEHQVYAALVRLSQANDPRAVTEAKKRLAAESEWVRAGAAEALGRAGDKESGVALVSLLSDRSALVREHALKALSYRSSADARLALESFLTDGRGGPREQAMAHMSLSKLVPFAERGAHVQATVKLADAASGDAQKIEIWQELIGIAPRDPAVTQRLERMLTESAGDDLRAMAIRHLSATEPQTMRTRIAVLRKDQKAKIRLAAVQSIAMTCPSERIEILREVIAGEKDPDVWRSALQAAAQMPSPETKKLLRSVKEHKDLGESSAFVDDAIRAVEGTSGPDPCSLRFPAKGT